MFFWYIIILCSINSVFRCFIVSNYRKEYDSIGEIEVEESKKWGSQTQRSIINFKISSEKMPLDVIYAIVIIKKISAKVNFEFGILEKDIMDHIVFASNDILNGKYDDQFPLVVWQTGSGTQTNMNVNEVISNIAIQNLGGVLGSKSPVHPNDHVNKSQSSNDTFPTAMHIATVFNIKKKLLPSLINITKSLKIKSDEFIDIIKIGRTHMQDATPLTLGQEFSSYYEQMVKNISRVERVIPELLNIAQGGTAVGTGINTVNGFSKRFAELLSEETSIDFKSSENKFESLSSRDVFIELSGILSVIATTLVKISSDIRLLSSGPRCGIGEIIIQSNEPGSSIMPGKVNPTQCEAIIMASSKVIGNNTTVNFACSQGGILELNVASPVIIYSVLQSINLISDSCNSINEKCISSIKPNYKNIEKNLNNSLMLVTALNDYIGYDKSSIIAKYAYDNELTLRDSAIHHGIKADDFDKWVIPKNMIKPKK